MITTNKEICCEALVCFWVKICRQDESGNPGCVRKARLGGSQLQVFPLWLRDRPCFHCGNHCEGLGKRDACSGGVVVFPSPCSSLLSISREIQAGEMSAAGGTDDKSADNRLPSSLRHPGRWVAQMRVVQRPEASKGSCDGCKCLLSIAAVNCASAGPYYRPEARTQVDAARGRCPIGEGDCPVGVGSTWRSTCGRPPKATGPDWRPRSQDLARIVGTADNVVKSEAEGGGSHQCRIAIGRGIALSRQGMIMLRLHRSYPLLCVLKGAPNFRILPCHSVC